MAPKHIKWLVALVVGVAALLFGIWGKYTGYSLEELPHISFGCIVAGVVLILLSIEPLHKANKHTVKKASPVRKGRRRRDAADEGTNRAGDPGISPDYLEQASLEDVEDTLRVDSRYGLTPTEAASRLASGGPNILEVVYMPSFLATFLDEIYEPTQLLLITVGVLYALVGSVTEAITALVVILLMANAEILTEWRAKRALARLKSSTPRQATVLRDGQAARVIPAKDVVRGDVVMLQAGMECPADVRLLSVTFLEMDESTLTGESVPVKKVAQITSTGPSAKRSASKKKGHRHMHPCSPFELEESGSAAIKTPGRSAELVEMGMAFAGTVATRGRGKGIVLRTGQNTRLGKILRSAKGKRPPRTPLQSSMRELAHVLTYAALGASFLGALLGLLQHSSWKDVVLTALSLCFATIPEELPILIAAVLAVGALSLSSHHIYVKNLRAQESLAFVDTILTDKTGTLTENRLQLHSVVPCSLSDDSPLSREAALPLIEAWLYTSSLDLSIDSNSFTPPRPPAQTNGLGQKKRSVSPPPKPGEGRRKRSKSPPPPPSQAAPSLNGTEAPADVRVRVAGVRDPFDRAVMEAPASTPEGVIVSQYLPALLPGRAQAVLVAERPFDSATKLASFSFEDGRKCEKEMAVLSMFRTFIRGAPDLLAAKAHSHKTAGGEWETLTPARRAELRAAVEDLCQRGLRVIGLASAQISGPIAEDGEEEEDSTHAVEIHVGILGYLAFRDPVRSSAAGAVAECQHAGVRVIMVTGDHPATARSVAEEVGLMSTQAMAGVMSSPDEDNPGAAQVEEGYGTMASRRHVVVDKAVCHCADIRGREESELERRVCEEGAVVFCRATPEDKSTLLQALQRQGHVVAVTGDGVNDAVALAGADVGLAMGQGTDVARAAAAIVMTEDDLGVLTSTLKEGRRLFANLRKAIAFYLGAKLALVLLFVVCTLWRRYPFSPIQIIVLELFMDVGASSTFTLEPADAHLMHHPPRAPRSPFFDAELCVALACGTVSLFACVLSAFAYAVLHLQREDKVTAMCFAAWLLGHVLLAYHFRTLPPSPVLTKSPFSNPAMLMWLGAVAGLAIALNVSPHLQAALHFAPALDAEDWTVVGLICVVCTIWIEVVKLLAYGLYGTPRDGTEKCRSKAINGTKDQDVKQPLLHG